ncbi:putative oxygenase [Daldinia decipiens]|uniref:putative oxygenase n=1 Tax=Daldinia decipiens TaxID=326647 RepID=UPI0020C1E34B|nr:putative oxygenase [Daldinia decipiens]KAI1658833.1 putative oxygenase [Daldinia decipiens]
MTVQSKVHPQVQRFPITADPATVWKAIADDGVAVIESFLTLEQVASLNKDVDPPLFKLREREKRDMPPTKALPSPWNPDKPQAQLSPSYLMADLVPPEVNRVHNLVGFSKTFRHDMLNHEMLHGLCRLAFKDSGDYWLGYGAVIENGPGTKEQPWHRDQPNYGLLKSGPDAPEGMLNFFTALTDCTPETGRTQYIWGSNRWIELGVPDADHPVVFSELNPGDTAILSGKIVHRGSANNTNTFRRALATMIIPGILTPLDATCNLSRNLVETMTPLAQRMVGRRSITIAPPSSIGIWCLNMREVGEQMNLKTNQPDMEEE